MSEPLTFPERAEAVLSACFRGIHNYHGKLEKTERHWTATCYRSLSTYDFDELTRLVLAAHKYHIRVEIAPANIRVLRIFLHDRERAGNDIWNRHPTIEQAIATFERKPSLITRALAVLRGYEPAEIRAGKAREILEETE